MSQRGVIHPSSFGLHPLRGVTYLKSGGAGQDELPCALAWARTKERCTRPAARDKGLHPGAHGVFILWTFPITAERARIAAGANGAPITMAQTGLSVSTEQLGQLRPE
jgi:hypothetical protein